jgi:hypothetical protein
MSMYCCRLSSAGTPIGHGDSRGMRPPVDHGDRTRGRGLVGRIVTGNGLKTNEIEFRALFLSKRLMRVFQLCVSRS